MTSLAQATAELRDAWQAFEIALTNGAPDTSERAAAWWAARENYRAFLLQPQDAQ